MRAVWLILVCACGSKAAPQPPSNTRPTPDESGAKPTYVENCEPVSKGSEPGHHDRFSFEDPKTTKWGFKNKAGKIVIPAQFEHVYEFSAQGIAGVVAPNQDGVSPFVFIDPSGKPIARVYPFDNGPDYFQEGLARIVDDHKRVGFIDERGTIVIPPKFVMAAPFCHGKAEVEIDDGSYFIDRKGNKTTPPAPDKDPHAWMPARAARELLFATPTALAGRVLAA